jgi:hypothetical protein
MEFEVQARGVALPEDERARAVAALARSLAPHQDHIARVAVRFFEGLGQIDQVETTCVVFVRMHQAASVVVEACDQDAELALRRAVRLACSGVEHRLERRRSTDRKAPRPDGHVVSAS